MFGMIKRALKRRKDRKMARRWDKAVQKVADDMMEAAKKRYEVASRSPRWLLRKAGLPSTYFTSKRTKSRQKAYRAAFYSVPAEHQDKVAAKYGEPVR